MLFSFGAKDDEQWILYAREKKIFTAGPGTQVGSMKILPNRTKMDSEKPMDALPLGEGHLAYLKQVRGLKETKPQNPVASAWGVRQGYSLQGQMLFLIFKKREFPYTLC